MSEHKNKYIDLFDKDFIKSILFVCRIHAALNMSVNDSLRWPLTKRVSDKSVESIFLNKLLNYLTLCHTNRPFFVFNTAWCSRIVCSTWSCILNCYVTFNTSWAFPQCYCYATVQNLKENWNCMNWNHISIYPNREKKIKRKSSINSMSFNTINEPLYPNRCENFMMALIFIEKVLLDQIVVFLWSSSSNELNDLFLYTDEKRQQIVGGTTISSSSVLFYVSRARRHESLNILFLL